ncbi:DUF3500 domain-containing protein [Fimbriiglobus ruber]|uniref:DUF3500 domain-containing protein n=1 Tax=Fimbriiglobus ruber TaxID=1908690 RepID=A0A225E0Z4_9BACT|nr:DUF3500 domain-containing protein [Fimbriiglobus ruber]OWK45474.1 hypothetical protein FRUB_01805 [Fimbriiglobus ruber]
MLGTVTIIALAAYAARDIGFSSDEVSAAEATAWRALAPSADATTAAKGFLDALDAKQKEKAAFEFASERKPAWSNLPTSFVPRNGVRMGDLSPEQRTKAMAVVAAVLSKEGYQKVVDIVAGDQMLAEGKGGGGGKGGGKDGKGGDKGGKGGKGGGKGGGTMFGAAEYYLAIFGTPSETKPWMVQFGGHHLGVNVTIIGKHFVLTPTHTGAQPGLFKRDGKDVRPLGQEYDAGFKLMGALDDKQRKQAIIGERPMNLLLGPGQDGKKIEPKGVKGSDLTADQQKLLLDVIAAWITIGEPEAAAARMEEIKGTITDTYFAWSGPTAPGSAAYFRVQGPTLVIEYAPQGGNDHIHTVIRNPKDDYGAALLTK